MAKKKSRVRPKGNRLWHAEPWWVNRPGEIIEPERINDDEHPLTLAWRRNKISQEQYSAGATYRVLYEKMHRTGRDSTQATGVSGGRGESFTFHQQEAGRDLAKIKAVLSPNDHHIVEQFCGLGHNMTNAVRSLLAYQNSSVKTRLHEALDALIAALDKQHIRRAA